MRFFVEQIALCVDHERREEALALLQALGMADWYHDEVAAKGRVYGFPASNEATLSFNYEAQHEVPTGLELEVLSYWSGKYWMKGSVPAVSHLGMHCSEGELDSWKGVFERMGIRIAQEVHTISHTNPTIAGKRWYHYCIFDTKNLIGVDLKFICRREAPGRGDLL